jgi:D-alanyl-D-alanine carboxypeptidase/D-alanyl-D-alanine-endopeptidase (penicillin-binding protein 4)
MSLAPRSGLALLAVALSAAPARADDLAAVIDKLILAPEYRSARWGLLVVEADSGKVVYERNADQLFAPASVTKLFSCAAALSGLGGDRRFETPVYRRGEVTEGRLHGDLILVAQGDLTLGGRVGADGKLEHTNSDHTYAGERSTRATLTPADPLAGLRALARQVKAAGVHALDGDVLIDDRLFAPAAASGSGPRLVTPIVVNDNVLDLIVTPGDKAGEAAAVRMRPETAYFQIEARVETVADEKKQGPRVRVEATGPGLLRVVGQVPVGSPPLVRIHPVESPAGFARALFIEALRAEGVAVKTELREAKKAELPKAEVVATLPRIAVYTSLPLRELVKVTLKVSQNLYASTLPLLLAVHKGKRTQAEGMALQGKELAALGVDVATIALESGAGGGDADKVTPRATVQLLRAMRQRSDFADFRAALPVLGVDGTLADVVEKDSPARGKVQAKTGTYTDGDLLNERVLLRSKALAGYLTTAKGKELVFCFFVNDVFLAKGVEPSREGKVLGKLCEAVYQHGP